MRRTDEDYAAFCNPYRSPQSSKLHYEKTPEIHHRHGHPLHRRLEGQLRHRRVQGSRQPAQEAHRAAVLLIGNESPRFSNPLKRLCCRAS